MFDAIRDLLKSEKAVAGGALVLAATVLVAIGKMSVDTWTSYTQVIFGVFASTKTITSVGAMLANRAKPDAASAPEDKPDA